MPPRPELIQMHSLPAAIRRMCPGLLLAATLLPALFLWGCAGIVSGKSAADTTPPQTYNISGLITPGSGGSGATIKLSGAASASTTVNGSGAFTFSGLANGTYTLTPSRAGYTFSPTSQNYINSSRWVYNGSYVKLKNISLSYHFPQAWLGPRVKNLELYVSSQNLFTITKYPGYDPEITNATNGITQAVAPFSTDHDAVAAKVRLTSGFPGASTSIYLALMDVMNLTPRGIREHLKLNRPIFARTSAFGHFGRAPEADGGFSWEKTDLADTLRSLA